MPHLTGTPCRHRRDFGVQPFEETLVDGFRRDLPNKVCVGDMLTDHLLDCAAIACLGFDEQHRFRLFHNSLFPTVRAGDWKPIRANRQLLFKEGATYLPRLIGSVNRDVVNSHD
jgi:hypothetical protein